jgi:hypothetical protein
MGSMPSFYPQTPAQETPGPWAPLPTLQKTATWAQCPAMYVQRILSTQVREMP